MMGGGEFKSSLLQQMMWSGGTDSKNMMSGLMPCAEEQEASNKMPPLSSPSMLLPQHLLQISSGLAPEVNSTANSHASDLHDGQETNDMPESWSQLLLGGLVGDRERYSAATALLSKGLEEGPIPQAAAAYNLYGPGGGEEIQASGTNKSQVSQMLLASSPRSCVTTSLGSNMLDFSSSTVPAPEVKNHHSDNSSEGNSTASGSAPKKARVQTSSSSAQSTLKVRKERLGDRITALHQIVSPFGKTDTASVLQETIGYIRFLLSQIEALSFPYLGHGNGNSTHQQHTVSLLNPSTGNGMVEAEGSTQQDEGNGGGDEGTKDLRSRGLCLVPVSCTSHLADDNGASDFWAVAAAPTPPPPTLGGMMVWR
ncbi:Transcription factor bHLH68 [Dichanthelium oligosanthes]|uniref:Transcription factor bHLH68 n=1 Tax=Dichanthelium oligosanthes TaxID=888268 RepID=A0A1E5W479_9POAL|nr:Transcription factor bHLH68 [Dichanthelium oligosanthes]